VSETVKAKTTSPLDEKHSQLGARMIDRDDWLIPGSYGNVDLEYRAVREAGAGLLDLSPRGRILVSGAEAVQFLNGLITNDIKTLAPGMWMPAAFPNVQGRLVASVRIARPNENEEFVIDTEGVTHEKVLRTIEKFTLAGDFHVRNVTSSTVLLSLQGKATLEIAQKGLTADLSSLASHGVQAVAWGNASESFPNGLLVMDSNHTGAEGLDFIVSASEAVRLWDALQNAGAVPLGYEALETLRIEAGIPRYGVDMDETNVVTEVLFDDAVSYSKGCYLGQEIIARIKYRGHVAKRLSGVKFEQRAEVAAGDAVKSDEGKEIGRLTSVTYSPALQCTIGLALLKYDYLSEGTTIQVSSDVRGQVASLPFV
jgi:aminomethyltransferase